MLIKLCTVAVLLLSSQASAAQSVPILSITFEGNAAVESARLKSQLRVSREGSLFQPEILRAELENIGRYYQDGGYLRAKVGTPQVTFREIPGRGRAAMIRVSISEGPLYTLGDLGVRSINAFDASTLIQISPIQKGQPFNRRTLNNWREKIADGYRTMGYIRFESELIEKVNDSNHVVDCVLQCTEGNPFHVGKITILGITAAEQFDFKRRLLLSEGGLYNPEMVGLSVHFINQMGIYKPLSGPDVEVKIDDENNAVDLVFHLVPQKKQNSIGPRRPVSRDLALGFSDPLPALQESQATIKTEVALVNVVFSAIDRNNRLVSGLTENDFLVFEDKKPQKVEFFSDLSKGTEVPLTIALLIDTSGSVKNKLGFEKDTAAEFFKSILRKGKDLALIIQFDSDVNLVQDFTDDTDRLVRALDNLEAGNSTSLYDAVFLAVDEKLKRETGRKVIVVITDGEDTSSKLRKEAAIEAAQKSDVLIYGIGVRGDFGANFGVLKKFADDTGGLFFSPHAKFAEIQAAFRAIGEDLHGQYSLAYSSTNQKRDGSFRNIEIRCKTGGVRTRARKGYYAPRADKGTVN